MSTFFIKLLFSIVKGKQKKRKKEKKSLQNPPSRTCLKSFSRPDTIFKYSVRLINSRLHWERCTGRLFIVVFDLKKWKREKKTEKPSLPTLSWLYCVGCVLCCDAHLEGWKNWKKNEKRTVKMFASSHRQTENRRGKSTKHTISRVINRIIVGMCVCVYAAGRIRIS